MRKIWVQIEVADVLVAHPLTGLYPFTTGLANDARNDGSSAL